MSREEAEAEDSKKKSDDMRLQMAIAKSKEGSEDDKKEVRRMNTYSCHKVAIITVSHFIVLREYIEHKSLMRSSSTLNITADFDSDAN